MGKLRLPWKRGPAAWKIVGNADVIHARLAEQRRGFFSLRRVAGIFGVSTQTVRGWVRFKYLLRGGPRGQFARGELARLLKWFTERAEPYPSEGYTKRFIRKAGRSPAPFDMLHQARFLWPNGRKVLTPRELAGLIGCHPSLIVKAIHHYGGLGRRKSPKRWEITRPRWRDTFRFSSIAEPPAPSLPRQSAFTTSETMEILERWGLPHTSRYRIRRMIKSGELEGIPPPAGQRRWLVTRRSLDRLRKNI